MTTKDMFKECIDFVLKWEGGKVDHPSDPGGRTNMGITQSVYDNYIQGHSGPRKDVYDMSREEAEIIYYTKYFTQIPKVESLCHDMQQVLFDTAVNFGVNGMIQFLQESLMLPMTGHTDAITLKRLLENNNTVMAYKIINNRKKYRYERCSDVPSQKVFLQGWLNRDEALRQKIMKSNIITPGKSIINSVREAIKNVALDIARSEMPGPGEGTNLEIWGKNTGPQIDKFRKYVGDAAPGPWCMYFVQYCVGKALTRIGMDWILPKTGYCPHIHEWARKNNILSNLPSPGDIMLLYLYDELPDHTGLVEEPGNSQTKCIEGNTNHQGSPEGIGIFERYRYNEDCQFVKWYNLITGREMTIIIANKTIATGIEIAGKTFVPIRKVCESIGMKVNFMNGSIMIGKDANSMRKVSASFYIGDAAWCPLRNITGDIVVSMNVCSLG